MIWEQPIHKDRPVKTWLSNPETGFSAQLIQLISHPVTVKAVGPAEMARYGKILLYANYDHIKEVCQTISWCSPYADYALFADARGLAHKMRSRDVCEWLEQPWKTAYLITDILVISDIPHVNDTDIVSKADRREVELLVDSRQKRGKCITILIGPNNDLDAVKKHLAIHKALKELDGSQS